MYSTLFNICIIMPHAFSSYLNIDSEVEETVQETPLSPPQVKPHMLDLSPLKQAFVSAATVESLVPSPRMGTGYPMVINSLIGAPGEMIKWHRPLV